jgi:hypothetical protein
MEAPIKLRLRNKPKSHDRYLNRLLFLEPFKFFQVVVPYKRHVSFSVGYFEKRNYTKEAFKNCPVLNSWFLCSTSKSPWFRRSWGGTIYGRCKKRRAFAVPYANLEPRLRQILDAKVAEITSGSREDPPYLRLQKFFDCENRDLVNKHAELEKFVANLRRSAKLQRDFITWCQTQSVEIEEAPQQ